MRNQRSFWRRALALLLGAVFFLACSAEEAGRIDYFTFHLQSPGDTAPVTEGYFYLPADHPYYPGEECGLFGWDFEGIAAWSDGSVAPVDDSADQGPDTYIQYWAKLDGSLCDPPVASFADAQFEYSGVRYFLDGDASRSFADLSAIMIPPDASTDWYATGTWSRSDDPNSGGEGYNWAMWPYEYFPSTE